MQVQGHTVEEYIASSQDRAKSAYVKSMKAAFLAWSEQLRGDQIMYESQRIMPLSCKQHWRPTLAKQHRS